MSLNMAALTHKGQVRAGNEDALFIKEEGRFAVVCDGMGGHNGGNVASGLAVEVMSNGLTELASADWEDEDLVVEAMKQSAFNANDHILRRAHEDPSLFDMGTTLVACAFSDDRVVTCNVGDSRIYRICDGMIEQVSEDHSLVAERIRAGELEEGSLEAKMLSNILTRALGMERVTVDITVEDRHPGDIYLLCTDGLTDVVEDSEIFNSIVNSQDINVACARLIDLANRRGGPDNITVAIVACD